MSDLQCPATFHVLGPGVGAARPLADGAVPVAVHAAGGRGAEAAGRGEVVTLDTLRPLWAVLEELSDLYRGVHVLVLPDQVVPPLRDAEDTVVVRIDADGRSVERP